MFSPSKVTILHCSHDRVQQAIYSRQGDCVRCEAMAEAVFPEASDGTSEGWQREVVATMGGLRPSRNGANPTVLVLAPQLTLSRHVQVPRVGAAQQNQILGVCAAQSIPYPLGDVVWDCVESQESKQTRQFLMVAARLEIVDALTQAVLQAGFDLVGLMPTAQALLSWHRQVVGQSGDPELVIQVGTHATTLLLVAGRDYATRTLLAFGVSDLQGSTSAERRGPEVIRSLRHFQIQNGMPAPARLRLIGVDLTTQEEQARWAALLQLPVTDATERGGRDVDEINHAPAAWPLGDRIVMHGAASQFFSRAERTLNLLPRRQRASQRQRQRRPWLVAAATLALLVPLGPAWHYCQVSRLARVRAAELESNLAPLRAKEIRLQSALRQLSAKQKQLATIQGVARKQGAWVGFLARLQEVINDTRDAWLERMVLLPGAAGSPLKLELSGRLLDQPGSSDAYRIEVRERAKILLVGLGHLPGVESVTQERFETTKPGLFGFSLVLVLKTPTDL